MTSRNGNSNIYNGCAPGTCLWGPRCAAAQQLSHGNELYYTFWFIYFAILAYKLVIAYALFVNAHAVKHFLVRLFSFKFLHKWEHQAVETGEEMVIAAKQLKGKNLNYWLTSFFATCLSW